MAVVALLATMVRADWVEDPFKAWNLGWGTATGGGDYTAMKVDGSDYPRIAWPYKIEYKPLPICNIPIYMKVGMFVQINKCKDLKIVLEQVSCADIGKGAETYPCYNGCATFDVRSNFPVKLGAELHKTSDYIVDWEAYYSEFGDTVDGDGEWYTRKLCVKAWNTKLYKLSPGDEVPVGNVDITVKPN